MERPFLLVQTMIMTYSDAGYKYSIHYPNALYFPFVIQFKMMYHCKILMLFS
jgi:hypothetical protein